MLISLKLLLVPAFLLLLSLAGKHFGPSIAGWLAGLPVVAGPIFFVLAFENGSSFAISAAAASTAAVFASVSFSIIYARVSQHTAWPRALAAALFAWILAASVLTLLPPEPLLSLTIAMCTLLIAPAAFPASVPDAPARRISPGELVLRMTAGASLTVAVSWLASALGSTWSGLLAVFPVLGIVLAVSSHRTEGAAFTSTLLRAMATGLYSFTAFCSALTYTLQVVAVPAAFAISAALSVAVHAATRSRLNPRSTGPTTIGRKIPR